MKQRSIKINNNIDPFIIIGPQQTTYSIYIIKIVHSLAVPFSYNLIAFQYIVICVIILTEKDQQNNYYNECTSIFAFSSLYRKIRNAIYSSFQLMFCSFFRFSK